MKSRTLIIGLIVLMVITMTACSDVSSATNSNAMTAKDSSSNVTGSTQAMRATTHAGTKATTRAATKLTTRPATFSATASQPSDTDTVRTEHEDHQYINGYLELNLGDWFSVVEDKKNQIFRLEPNVISKTTFIMLAESTGPMAEQWDELKEKILTVSLEIYEVAPDYHLVITNWGDRSDYLLFSARNGKIVDDYLTPKD